MNQKRNIKLKGLPIFVLLFSVLSVLLISISYNKEGKVEYDKNVKTASAAETTKKSTPIKEKYDDDNGQKPLLNHYDVVLKKGESVNINTKLNSSWDSIKLTSNNKKVATTKLSLNERFGTIKAVAKGKTTIDVEVSIQIQNERGAYERAYYYYTIYITVIGKNDKIKSSMYKPVLNHKNVIIMEGTKQELTYNKEMYTKVTAEIENEDIAKVTTKGKIITINWKSPGKTTLNITIEKDTKTIKNKVTKRFYTYKVEVEVLAKNLENISDYKGLTNGIENYPYFSIDEETVDESEITDQMKFILNYGYSHLPNKVKNALIEKNAEIIITKNEDILPSIYSNSLFYFSFFNGRLIDGSINLYPNIYGFDGFYFQVGGFYYKYKNGYDDENTDEFWENAHSDGLDFYEKYFKNYFWYDDIHYNKSFLDNPYSY